MDNRTVGITYKNGQSVEYTDVDRVNVRFGILIVKLTSGKRKCCLFKKVKSMNDSGARYDFKDDEDDDDGVIGLTD